MGGTQGIINRVNADGSSDSGFHRPSGTLGPGGAVIWLKRTSGETPRPAPRRGDAAAGPAVTGFGGDLPAFMLLRPRTDAKSEDTDA